LDHAWIAFTLAAAAAQTLRNATQRGLVASLGTIGATHVRFLFGLPFACLFLAIVVAVLGPPPSLLDWSVVGWASAGGVTQILATMLMLAAMKDRSFVVTIAYTKTEPVQTALVGLVLLGDHVTAGMMIAILVAVSGVLVLSHAPVAEGAPRWRPALLGMVSGGFFGLSAVSFRGAILDLGAPSFVLGASTILVLGLAIQVAIVTVWLVWRDRATLRAILAAWRPSLLAGFLGAFASQFWFLAFAIESAARVRTLALVEVFFAQIVSRTLFKEGVNPRDLVGVALVIVGVGLLLRA
jgi:drug/metabolite transporter (DMT)-like permease